MYINVNNRKYQIGWTYVNPLLETLLSFHGLTMTEAKKMKHKELCETLKTNILPLPNKVKCFIKDEKGEVIVESTITRHAYDAHCKEAARKYSLHRALNQVWTGRTPENLSMKKAIWNAYLCRPRIKEEKKILEHA